MKKTALWILTICLVAAMTLGMAACNKNVEDNPSIDDPIQAQGVTLNAQEVLAVKGSSVTLTHTFTPSASQGSVTYTSTDESVVRISADGVCTAVGTGVATVTVKLDDEHYATCRVIVGDMIVDSQAGDTQQAPSNTDVTQGQNQNQDNGGTAQEGIDTPGADGTQGNSDTTDGTNDTDTGNGTDAGESITDPMDAGNQGENNTQGNDGTDMGGEEGTDMGDNATDMEENNAITGSSSQDTTPADNGETGGDAATQEGTTAPTTSTDTEDLMNLTSQGQVTLIVGATEGTTLFYTVQEALNAAQENKTIVVNHGDYNEDIHIVKSVSIVGVGNPVLKSVLAQNNTHVTLENLTIRDTRYPQAGQASIHAKEGALLVVKDCMLRIETTDEPEGGYAILVDKQSAGVRIENNTIANYRYGIYVCPTSQEIVIQNNRLSHMATGIGVDVRQENAEADYPATGTIAGNEYNEVEQKTQFLHYSENYDGDLDFGDNEEENASNGESDAGGSGLLE